ncbi:MAG: nitrite/sulfite reductase [Lachnospiraceae bacterium]
MEAYKNTLKAEVEEFRKAGKLFLEGKLSKNEFKGKSGGMGVYAQQDQKSFMIRLRTPSGIITKHHLALILSYAKKYHLEKIHFTTRQAIQLHGLTIDQVCDIMKEAIDHDLFTRGGGGNFPRNVTLSPLSGVAVDEAFDVTPYACQVGMYFLKHATGYHLPRKLKVAFSNSAADTAGATINDVGFMAVLEEGKPMFRMWLAGGMGGGPAVGIPYTHLVCPEEVLYYIEAMVQLFMAEGDYEHKAKARIRFIPRRMGVEEFLKCYDTHLAKVKKECHFEGIVPIITKKENTDAESEDKTVCIAQKQAGLYSLILHPLCGQLTVTDFETIAEYVAKKEKTDIRISMEEEMYIRNLSKAEAEELWNLVGAHMMETPLARSLSCVGTPSCQMGILQSQKLCQAVIEAVASAGIQANTLPSIQISGCPNSCSRHQVAAIGFAGRKVKVEGVSEDAFTLQIGGCVTRDDTHMGEVKGVLLGKEIPAFLVELGQLAEEKNQPAVALFQDPCFQTLVDKYNVVMK